MGAGQLLRGGPAFRGQREANSVARARFLDQETLLHQRFRADQIPRLADLRQATRVQDRVQDQLLALTHLRHLLQASAFRMPSIDECSQLYGR